MKVYIIWGDYASMSDYSKVIAVTRTYKQAKNLIKQIEKDKYYFDEGLFYVEVYEDKCNGQVCWTDGHYGTRVEALCKSVFKDYYGEED